MSGRQVRPDFTPVLPVLAVEKRDESVNDLAHLQLEIVHAARALDLLSRPGADAASSKLASDAFREAALWSDSLGRRDLWLRCSWLLSSASHLPTALAIDAGVAPAQARVGVQ